MRSRMGFALTPARLAGLILGISAVVALALAVVGVYGVTSFVVSRRIKEIGIRLALGARPAALWTAVAAFLLFADWALFHVFGGRAAYIHVGAIIGTIMVANVFFVIIPGQKRMLAQIRAGQEPDPTPGRLGKIRSVHNTYLTLPVLFIMISNHYPLTYGSPNGWIVLAALSAAFGALATLLAAIGLYGVMAFVVARRTREIGLRMALGAGQGTVIWSVMSEVLLLLGIGLAIGVPAAFVLTRFAVSRFLADQLYGVKPHDFGTSAIALGLLAVVALAAGFLPARRASTVDPMLALRYE